MVNANSLFGCLSGYSGFICLFLRFYMCTAPPPPHSSNLQGHVMGNLNLCIVTHGLTLRLFLMRWLQYSVDEFEVCVFRSTFLKLLLLKGGIPAICLI